MHRFAVWTVRYRDMCSPKETFRTVRQHRHSG